MKNAERPEKEKWSHIEEGHILVESSAMSFLRRITAHWMGVSNKRSFTGFSIINGEQLSDNDCTKQLIKEACLAQSVDSRSKLFKKITFLLILWEK